MADSDDDSVGDAGNVAPGKDLPDVDVLAGLRDKVAGAQHGKEINQSQCF